MGNKGDKLSNEAGLSVQLLLEKLSGIEGISSKTMFGGYGIFCNGKMFGMVDPKGKVLFKADDITKSEFENLGSIKHSRMPYYLIPEDIFNDVEKLTSWARKSISIIK